MFLKSYIKYSEKGKHIDEVGPKSCVGVLGDQEGK
jgi:hypothetical protein